MSLKTKYICGVVLCCAILVILGIGRVNISNFEKVRDSIEGIHADRLVVNGLIFDLSSLLHDKEIAIISNDLGFFARTNELVNKEIVDHLTAFRATKLTAREELTLEQFSKGVEALQENEKRIGLLKGTDDLGRAEVSKLTAQLRSLQKDLKSLSAIQLSEGEKKLLISNKAVDSMYGFQNIVNYTMIVISLLLILLILLPTPQKQR